jgi:hypothetical protein
MPTTPAPTTSTGLKNAVTQPLTSQYKTVATGTATTAKPTVVVQVSADLRVEPKDAELLGPASVVTQQITGHLEHGKRTATNAIVLHMTGGMGDGVLGQYEKEKTPNGAHFMIMKSGEIIQTAKLDYQTRHVGNIRPKGYQPNGDNNSHEDKSLLTADEIVVLRNSKTTFKEKLLELHHKQLKKPYGSDPKDKNTRYPGNEDAIGIEFESLNDVKTKPKTQATVKYEELTAKQITSGKVLVKFLKEYYKLTDADIYEHADISYKMQDEAHGTKGLVK